MLVSQPLSCLVAVNEQVFNVKFVGEVEKFPVLYNYKLEDYSRKDVTEKAWNEVAKIVNLPTRAPLADPNTAPAPAVDGGGDAAPGPPPPPPPPPPPRPPLAHAPGRFFRPMLLVLTSLLVWQFVFSSWFKARLLEPLFTIKAARGAGGVLGGGDGDGGGDGGGGGGGGPLWRPGDPVDWEPPPVQINDMQLCPLIPPGLQGPFQPPLDVPPLRELSLQMAKPLALQPGGAWRPARCRARHRVAVVVPYRDRPAHLATLLATLHPLLHRQQIDYRIVVVEQEGHGPFNRAMLLNVGYKEALKLYDFQCFIFHDVDLLPEDDRNMYICPEQPRHMSVAVDVFNYRLPYEAIFGGVSAMTTEQFLKVNGFSNSFWGWGAEDDDMRNRIKHYGLQLSRYPSKVARYKMLIHKKQQANRNRFRLLYSGSKRFSTDGLNSLRYIRKKLILYPLYTHVLVELDIPDFEKSIWLKS